MVKNTSGGSRHKKQARKNVNAQQVRKKTRLKDPKEPCEIYAVIIKNFGQGNCEVLCNDNEKRMCVIRNKFKGRNKRSNRVDVGVRVLVGLRDWEVRASSKMEKCDLLEVYDTRELEDLKKDPNFNETLLRSEEEKVCDEKGDSMFVFNRDGMFGEEDDDETDKNAVVGTSTSKMKEFEEIDIDNI